MPVPMSARRANFPALRRRQRARSPLNDVEVPSPQALHRLRVATRLLVQGGSECRMSGMGPGFFFPASSVALARGERVCARCSVAAECLVAALEDRRFTECGCTSTREREYLRSEEGLGWG